MRLFICFLLIASLPVGIFAQNDGDRGCKAKSQGSRFETEFGIFEVKVSGRHDSLVIVLKRVYESYEEEGEPHETLKLYKFNGSFRAIRVNKKINNQTGRLSEYNRLTMFCAKDEVCAEHSWSPQLAYPVEVIEARYWDCKNLYDAMWKHYYKRIGSTIRLNVVKEPVPNLAKDDIVRLFRYPIETFFYKRIKTYD